MLKASALYIVIVIALVIGVLCSSLIVMGYFYRLQYQKVFRYDRLENNVNSGVNMLLADDGDSFTSEKILDLFGNYEDSVSLRKIPWGLYDVGVAEAFVQKDTLYKTFAIANTVDSTKWAALYLIDEDRPVSVSGKTMIRGSAYIPKAGIKEAYVDGKSYQGDKRLIIGKRRNSERKLPELNTNRLNQLEHCFNEQVKPAADLLRTDSLQNSFLSPTRLIGLGKQVKTLENIRLSGNIMIFSDTTLIIGSSAILDNVVVFAKTISVKSGFHGSCQLFATDSIGIAPDCVFTYPSAVAVVRFQSSKFDFNERINIGENSSIYGWIFTYEKDYSASKQPLIDLGRNVKICGQVYSQGMLGLKDGVVINGSVFTGRFLYQSSFTRFENYIINTTIDETGLSSYYLNSDLVPVSGQRKKVLQWLEAN